MTRTRKAALSIPNTDITLAPKSHGRRGASILTKTIRENDHSEKVESSVEPSPVLFAPPSVVAGPDANINVDVGLRPSTPIRSKQAILIDLLKREAGASLKDMMTATGWQKHSVRGFISGTLKKKLGLAIASSPDQVSGARVYRIVDEPLADPNPDEGRAGVAADAEVV